MKTPVRSRPTRPATVPKPGAGQPFPIVGIGASAGGLEALAQFLEQVPLDSGMAYVIVLHLDPTQKGMMPELLQRATALKVVQVKDRTRVRPNAVYVIPPNRDLSLLRGVLHLLTPVGSRGLRLPIDFFFRSLAEDQQERSVGIILSGMGSDGTLGLKAIKEKAGVALVQDPATAKFDAMPTSVIEAGLADFVASADQLPARLLAYQRHLPRIIRSGPQLEGRLQGSMEKIVILLRSHTGHDFTLYRRSALHRRVERRMGIHQMAKIGDYVRYLQENAQERGILFKELLIGVTSFFRDPAAWAQLAKKAIPALLASRPEGGVLRAWVAGCSTGEEAYTLAMVFTEAMQRAKPASRFTLQIYATDLDKDAIEKARVGLFPASIAADVSAARLDRFFVKEAQGYRVNKEIRAMVVFAPQNLIMDPPFTRLDLLSCRNLLIYLTHELQQKLFPLFHYSLNPGGVLFLGSAESIGAFPHLFTALAPKERIFRRGLAAAPGKLQDFPAVFVPSRGNRPRPPAALPRHAPSLQSLADQLLLTRLSPAAVLISSLGDILYIHGRTGNYLEPAAGQANWNILALARKELRGELASVLQRILRHKGAAAVRGVKVTINGSTRAVDLVAEVLEEPIELRGLVLIVFSDTAVAGGTTPPAGRRKSSPRPLRQQELERELARARQEVQLGHEEMQTSQEELKSVNEELQSTNEEMQSTNEELMTSKEEMQSLNEELQTVNAELQAKLDELSGANNDMKNLLNSTDIAMIFLDNELGIRRYTQQAKSIIKLIEGDVGRPITDLASDLVYPALEDDVREVLRTLEFSERPVATRDGRWFTVRIMPYHTMDNRIDGVVITFADITGSKQVEADLREQQSDLTRHSTQQGVQLERALERLRVGARPRRAGTPASKAKP